LGVSIDNHDYNSFRELPLSGLYFDGIPADAGRFIEVPDHLPRWLFVAANRRARYRQAAQIL
jgi:hypothetical protein